MDMDDHDVECFSVAFEGVILGAWAKRSEI